MSSAGALPGMDVLIDRMKAMVQDTKMFSSMDEQIPAFYTKVRRLVRAKRAEPDCQFMHATDYLAMMYGTFRIDFHRFDWFKLDLRGHTQPRGAAGSCLRFKWADMVLI